MTAPNEAPEFVLRWTPGQAEVRESFRVAQSLWTGGQRWWYRAVLMLVPGGLVVLMIMLLTSFINDSGVAGVARALMITALVVCGLVLLALGPRVAFERTLKRQPLLWLPREVAVHRTGLHCTVLQDHPVSTWYPWPALGLPVETPSTLSFVNGAPGQALSLVTIAKDAATNPAQLDRIRYLAAAATL